MTGSWEIEFVGGPRDGDRLWVPEGTCALRVAQRTDDRPTHSAEMFDLPIRRTDSGHLVAHWADRTPTGPLAMSSKGSPCPAD